MYASCIGMPKGEIDTPALLIDLDIMEANIATMAAFFSQREARLRPHAKTHKTPIIAHRQLAAGAIGITCAKLGEAEVLAASGIRDILVANQIVGATKVRRLANLARYTDVMVAVDDPANVAELSAAVVEKGTTLRVLVEVDTGMKRCGVAPGEPALALARRVAAAPGLAFAGLMGYEGHAVFIADAAERRAITEEGLRDLIATRDLIEAAGLPVGIVSGGGTGTYSITGAYPGITEVQAGSYVLMDTRYRETVPEFGCALTLLSTVISRPDATTAITDAGMKVLTQEFGLPEVVWPRGARLARLSEEHGKLELSGEALQLRPGDRVELIPSHCCTTINLHDRFYALRDGVVEAVWDIAGRGRSQ